MLIAIKVVTAGAMMLIGNTVDMRWNSVVFGLYVESVALVYKVSSACNGVESPPCIGFPSQQIPCVGWVIQTVLFDLLHLCLLTT